ncbi:MAG: exopolysaccharide biosynthesis protein [Chthoniobacteraceae bacterium]
MSSTPDTGHPTPAEEVLEPISAELRSLVDVAQGQPMSLSEIETHLKDRGYALLVLFLSAPFLLPSIPGLSVPFGIAIALIGIAFMLRRRPRLPGFILRKKVEFATLQKVIPVVARLMERLERHMRPRLRFLVAGPVMTSLLGLGIVSGGFFLSLPLPIPLTNSLPALSIIFLITGLLCRDGLAILCGHLLGLASWAYLGVWIYFGARMVPWLRSLWGSVMHWF